MKCGNCKRSASRFFICDECFAKLPERFKSSLRKAPKGRLQWAVSDAIKWLKFAAKAADVPTRRTER